MGNNEYVSAFLSTARVLDGTLHGRLVRDPVTGNMERDRTTLYADKDFLKNATMFDNLRAEAKQAMEGRKKRGVASPYDTLMNGIDLHKCVGASGPVDDEMRETFESAVRTFIVDNFSTDPVKSHEYLDIFFSDGGDFILGLEQVFVFGKKMDADLGKSASGQIAKGFVTLLMSYALEQEFNTLYKSKSTGGIVVPLYNVNEQLFTWKRASSILRKYALYAVKPKDYDCYCIESPDLIQRVFLFAIGKSIDDVHKIMKEQKTGFFYSFLTFEEEAVVMPEILSGNMGGFDTNNEYVAAYRKLADKIISEYKNEMYNVYTIHVKPIMIESMGMFVKDFDAIVEENGWTTDEAFIYNLAPNRLGVALCPEISSKGKAYINKTFKAFGKRWSPVTKPLTSDFRSTKWI